MGLFDNMLSDSQTLFKDESVLDFDYIPPNITNRDMEIGEIVESIKPLLAGRRPSNLFITGPPGIGKTLTVKHVLATLKEETEDIVPCYVNNWNFSTYHSVFVELSKFFGVPSPRKGVSTDDIAHSILSKAQYKKGAVMVFDEVDKAENLDFLYPILEGMGKKVCIILISNYSSFFEKMDPRLLSRLNLSTLNFKEYSYSQIKEILSERVKYAFFPNVLDDDAFKEIVKETNDSKDVRFGISLLLRAGRIAERDASKKITIDHVKEAISELKKSSVDKRIDDLDDKEKILFDLIKKNEGAITGDLYDLFCKEYGTISLRTFRKYLNKLETLSLIRTEQTGAGFRGKSRRVFIR